jgi:hypothetical protein
LSIFRIQVITFFHIENHFNNFILPVILFKTNLKMARKINSATERKIKQAAKEIFLTK